MGGVPGDQGAPEHGGQACPRTTQGEDDLNIEAGRYLGDYPAWFPHFLDGKSERTHFQAFCLTHTRLMAEL